MKPFLVALIVGLAVGAFYGLLNVRSPAPPYVALLGLLGILLGEQGAQSIRARYHPPSPPQLTSAPATPEAGQD